MTGSEILDAVMSCETAALKSAECCREDDPMKDEYKRQAATLQMAAGLLTDLLFFGGKNADKLMKFYSESGITLWR